MVSVQNRRMPLALLAAVVSIALAAIIQPALAGAATATNPAASSLGPVSTNAQPRTGVDGTATRAAGAATGATPSGGVGAPTTPATSVPTTTYAPPATQTTAPAAAATTTSRAAAPRKSSSSTSAGAIALAAVAALLALAALAWGLARWLAYEPHWTLSLRHAMGEAGFRASSTWAEFTDWARLGR